MSFEPNSTPSGQQGATSAPTGAPAGAEGQGSGQPAAQPAGGQPAPVQPAGRLYAEPGDFDPENLREMFRKIWPENPADGASAQSQEPVAQPEGETPPPAPQGPGIDLAKWQGLGAFEQVESAVGMLEALGNENPAGFWQQLQVHSPDTVISVLDAAIAAFPDF